MTKQAKQTETWSSGFGKDYTDRNAMTLAQLEASYVQKYGVTRTAMNERFLGSMATEIRILEVGSNIGLQLECLQKMGFKNLYGLELQWYAVERSKERTKAINLIQGTAFDVPFKDAYFDLVFTSGVLIHIDPKDHEAVMKEIHRCSRSYVWGFEYYSPEIVAVEYRGSKDLLWKADFAKIYQRTFPDLELRRQERFPYLKDPNEDVMFLLKKR